jgi:hypothetical protein
VWRRGWGRGAWRAPVIGKRAGNVVICRGSAYWQTKLKLTHRQPGGASFKKKQKQNFGILACPLIQIECLMNKGFLVLFCKKEPLASLRVRDAALGVFSRRGY